LGAVENRHPQPLRWGRVGIEFFFENWRPDIFAGFLLDGKDHKLDLVDPTKGIDLMLLIEADSPSTSVSGGAIRLAAQRILTVPNTVALDQDQVKSKWRKLVVRTPLADIIVAKNTDEQQTQAMYERFAEWGRVLFEDGTLESAFRDTWPKDVPGTQRRRATVANRIKGTHSSQARPMRDSKHPVAQDVRLREVEAGADLARDHSRDMPSREPGCVA
jgi:hypothetical protein